MATQTAHRHTNRLIHAISPYLLQHAHNPVDWYEWGPEALEKTKREGKLIFLSIGYAACHWCHVMEHESFETQEVAAALNADFVSIKVDREERPDIDEIYMAFTQRVTGRGGWPMSVWLTPEGTPFHAGTYFPQVRFLQILGELAERWSNDPGRILEAADGAVAFFSEWSAGPAAAEGVVSLAQLGQTATRIAGYFDRSYGGMRSRGNKFPPSLAMDLLLRVHRRSGRSDLLDVVEITLDNMARGGIYDHLGGGICRYSTDPQWLVPHFEKMLYDQALVSSIYLDAHLAIGKPWYGSVAADIFDYVIADLQTAEGGFCSSRDADSEGLEGAFYIWTVKEVTQILGEEEGRLFCAYYDVTDTGNWFESRGHAPKGAKNILHVSKTPEVFAKVHGLKVDDLHRRLGEWRRKLLAVRGKRVPPALDDKILTGWNGLMIAGLAKGARVLDKPKYAEAAAKAADFILDKLRRDGRLLRSYRGGKSHLTGYLSDYAFFIEGLLNLYEATFDRKWLHAAFELNETCIKYYYDADGGAFFFTASDGEKLLARSKDPYDKAVPSGNSTAALNLLRLSILFDRKDYREKAESIFRTFGASATQSPGAFERLLCAVDFYHDRVKEIAIIGDPDSTETKALIRTVFDRYLPNKVVVHSPDKVVDKAIPLLTAKTRMNGRSTAYVCENFTCKRPVADPETLARLLEAK